MNKNTKLDLSNLDNVHQSASRRLEAILPIIEGYLAQGVKHQDVVTELNSQGFNISLEYFRLMLSRLRKRHREPAATTGIVQATIVESVNLTSMSTIEKPEKTAIIDRILKKPILNDQQKKKVFKFDPHAPVKW